jgi:hypothetical protein
MFLGVLDVRHFRELRCHIRGVGPLGRGCQGEGHLDVEAACGAGAGGEGGAVGVGDGPDDGQAEPVSLTVAGSLVPSCRNGWNRSCTASGGTSVPVLLTATTAPAVVSAVEMSANATTMLQNADGPMVKGTRVGDPAVTAPGRPTRTRALTCPL